MCDVLLLWLTPIVGVRINKHLCVPELIRVHMSHRLLLAVHVDSAILPKASMITTGLFLGLTWVAFTTRKDFSFLQGVLRVGFFVALGTIVASIVFGFDLGIIFSSLMLILLGGSVLYQTSNIIHHYQTTQHVAAALALFASFATMLWYVIRILLHLAASRE